MSQSECAAPPVLFLYPSLAAFAAGHGTVPQEEP